jgi:hypothetical protein
MRVRRFLHILLLAGVIALLWQVVATWRRPLPDLMAASPNTPEGEAPPPSTPGLGSGLHKQLANAIADKDLFSPSRSRTIEESAPVKETVPPPSHLKLVGVFLSPKREEAFFVDSSQGGKVVRVRKGESLGAYQLTQVTPLHVTLTVGQDGDEVTLPLLLLDSGTAVKAPRLMPAVQRPGAAKPGQPATVVTQNAEGKQAAVPPGMPNEVGIRQDILRLQQRLRRIRQRATREQSTDEGNDGGNDEEDEE